MEGTPLVGLFNSASNACIATFSSQYLNRNAFVDGRPSHAVALGAVEVLEGLVPAVAGVSFRVRGIHKSVLVIRAIWHTQAMSQFMRPCW